MALIQRARQPQQPNTMNPVKPGYMGNIQAYRNSVQQGPQQTPYGRSMPPLRIYNKV